MKTRIRTAAIALAALAATTALSSSALAQDLPPGTGNPPVPDGRSKEQKEMMKRSGDWLVRARQLLGEKRAEDALAAALESIRIAEQVPIPGNYYLLGECYIALGKDKEAAEAIRRRCSWELRARSEHFDLSPEPSGDFLLRGPPIIATLEYALALFRLGRVDDAKRLYYVAMRESYELNPRLPREPMPFAVVFDPDPKGEVWEYTPQNFEAAALMLKAIGNPTPEGLKLAEMVRKLKPDWLYPTLFMARHSNFRDSAPWFDRARALARTAEEREAIRRLEELRPILWHREKPAPELLPPDPFAFRRGLAILESSRKDLHEHREPLIAPKP